MNKITKKWIEIFEKPLMIGKVISNKYVIEQVLGKGSYGFSYLVKDRENNSKVLKQLRKYKLLEESGRDSFKREAAILKTLNHHAFPVFYEELEDEQKRFIVMEYKSGKTYEELIFLENTKFDEDEAIKELSLVLDLVKIIHQMGCVHRDLRIPNLLKDGEKNYIIDFGLARFLHDEMGQEEKPRQIEKRLFREIAYKSDFYALGHFLLFLLYSSFEPESKKKQSWEEELKISSPTKRMLRKMLQLDEPYEHVDLLITDVLDYLK